MKRFIFEQRVRWEDCDPGGLIFYGNYFRYFEAAEEELLRSTGTSEWEMKQKYNIALGKTDVGIQFFAPALYDDLIEVQTWIPEYDDKRYLMRFEVYKQGTETLLCKAHAKVICMQKGGERLRAREHPPELLEILETYAEEGARKEKIR
ncbi:MAG: acyl-CoA thioesterase [Candidatus Tectomicrobia bacterium]|nr:acyl-CoA thioesterase [Candidatus Tectomicrobia bacterium]